MQPPAGGLCAYSSPAGHGRQAGPGWNSGVGVRGCDLAPGLGSASTRSAAAAKGERVRCVVASGLRRQRGGPGRRLQPGKAGVGVLPEGGEAAGQRAAVQLQLMAIRIEEVERGALAAILFPLHNAGGAQRVAARGKVGICQIQRQMAVVAARAHRITRQADPQLAERQIGAAVPAHLPTQPQQIAIKA